MPFAPLSSYSLPTPAEQVWLQIETAHNLALRDRIAAAGRVCSVVFLEHAALLARDDMLLAAYVECLLLLEMTALLARVLQAIHGTTVNMTPGRSAGVWRVSFGNGRVVTVTLAAGGLDRVSAALLMAAAGEPMEVRTAELVSA